MTVTTKCDFSNIFITNIDDDGNIISVTWYVDGYSQGTFAPHDITPSKIPQNLLEDLYEQLYHSK